MIAWGPLIVFVVLVMEDEHVPDHMFQICLYKMDLWWLDFLV
jgi:hypothetical protein